MQALGGWDHHPHQTLFVCPTGSVMAITLIITDVLPCILACCCAVRCSVRASCCYLVFCSVTRATRDGILQNTPEA